MAPTKKAVPADLVAGSPHTVEGNCLLLWAVMVHDGALVVVTSV